MNKKCLYHNPLIEMRESIPGKKLPEQFERMHTTQFWFFVVNDFIDIVVAMRIYPNNDLIVFKVKLKNSSRFRTIIVRDPSLQLLEAIWNCRNQRFNAGIEMYLRYSGNAFLQWSSKSKNNNRSSEIIWYHNLIKGSKKING